MRKLIPLLTSGVVALAPGAASATTFRGTCDVTVTKPAFAATGAPLESRWVLTGTGRCQGSLNGGRRAAHAITVDATGRGRYAAAAPIAERGAGSVAFGDERIPFRFVQLGALLRIRAPRGGGIGVGAPEGDAVRALLSFRRGVGS